jgi:alkylhydroperoxidase/carboxymuconolactone decarboxylase family protein YurZ
MQVTASGSAQVPMPKEERVAAITHIAFYAGWPMAASGLNHMKNVLEKK